MLIRTTTLGTTNSMLGYIQSGQSRYYELAQQASSGSKLTKPSDDPAAAKSVLGINVKLNQLSSYLQNMSLAQGELDVLDDTLASVADSIQTANDYATQAANGTYNTSDLKTIKTQVDQILENVLDLANTKYNGNYLFSGTATGTPAYSITKDPATGEITAVTYNGTKSGDAYQRYVTISDGVQVVTNTTGDKVFGSYDKASSTADGLIGNLVTLSNALSSADTTTIQNSLDKFDTNLDSVLAARTRFAAVTQRFEMTESSINTTVTQLKDYRSNLQDADLASVLTELSAQKTALEATMAITTQLLKGASLLDYM